MIEVDGEQLIEIDKLNGVYKVKGVDMLAKVRSLIYSCFDYLPGVEARRV